MLEIDHLSKSYGDVHALDGLTFNVNAGEIFGFVGSNGAGKTTAMRIMLGVLAADAGTVRWGGRELDLNTRRTVGYMPEERGLYPKMKVGEQLRYLAGLHGMAPDAAAAAVDHWTDLLGVGGRREDSVDKLSLGNQQRVQLAAALVHDPLLLVLDEPFSGLDPVAVDVMSGVLRERASAGVPVIFSSHQLDLVERLCDRVGIVRSGKMQALGTIDELRTTESPRWTISTPEPVAVAAALTATGLVAHVGDDNRTVIVATDGTETDDQSVLRSALSVAPVHEFTRVRPSLADLFRDVVSADEPPVEPTRPTTRRGLFGRKVAA